MSEPVFWTDERVLEALDLMDHDGLSAREVGRRFGTSKNSVLGMRFRVLGKNVWTGRRAEPGDGTMPRGWWRR